MTPLRTSRGVNCMCILHKWGEWQEEEANRHPWQHPKFQVRMCLHCEKEKRRVMPSLEERIVELFEKGHTERGLEDALNYFKESYGVARYTRITKDLMRY